MMTATPDRKPVRIGADRNSANQPRRRMLTSITMRPTITARIATRSTYRADPVRARADTPAAKSGAIVESAPTDICGFEPKKAKRTDPATNA